MKVKAPNREKAQHTGTEQEDIQHEQVQDSRAQDERMQLHDWFATAFRRRHQQETQQGNCGVRTKHEKL
jgi:hypothetical protein